MINCCSARRVSRAPNPDELIVLFNQLFQDTENTRLVRGGDEPVYLPADAHCAYHRVIFARGFFASALHEIAHWCIAGPVRRRLPDYGYWYVPDGRSEPQQRAFERVEVKPQALEWILSRACNRSFQVSADNLSGASTDATPFKRAVYRQVLRYCVSGIPLRAARLRRALVSVYDTPDALDGGMFDPREIGLSAVGEGGP